MLKGEATRNAILSHAADVASGEGLEGLSIGGLARDLNMSKSGLFAHFQSKEGLQVRVVEFATGMFTEAVIRPALKQPRGLPRLHALLDAWLAWIRQGPFHAGCFFMAAAMEMDDRPGPVRDALAQQQHDWMGVIRRVAQTAVDAGELAEGTDTHQLAFELYGAMMAYHHAARLLEDDAATARVRTAFHHILQHAARA